MKNPVAYLLVFYLFLSSCSGVEKEEPYVIAFSQCMMDDVWRQAMMLEMNIEASNYDNIRIVIADAKESNETQIKQIQQFIDQKVDVLIISPNQSDSITPIAVEAYRKGIPTIIVDRKIGSEEYTTYVGGDSYEIGRIAGEYASAFLPENATIAEVWGTKLSSPAQERHLGFINGLKKKNVNIKTVVGNWRREIAKKEVSQLEDFNDIDLVYAHNDVMALGAREAISERDSALVSKIIFLGVDAAFGKGAGLEAVANGLLNASFLYPTGGDQVIRVAMKILNKEQTDKKYILNTAVVEKNTARTLLLQSDQLINYQNRIEQQKRNIDMLFQKFSMLRHSLFLILSLLALLLFFAIYIFYINRKINKKNKQLHIKNKESEEQKQKLICLNEKIEQVTSQKLQFFTNVSHEVRTPLTLIVGPLEKWIKSTPESPLLSDLKLMKKNADRLMRVINQLLDFRKIENNKMGLTISQVDIVAFTENVMSLFEDLAKSKQICYEFVSEIPTCQIWIDQDKMEKVLTNLLSNAFKFTAVGGKISVQIKDGPDKIYIALQDNGIGIDEKDIEKIFDRFYTGSVSSGVGAGIGLHLTQEFVKMHQGQILVESVPNDYTIFTIELLKGKDHLPDCFPLVHPEDRVDLASTSMNVEKPDDLLAKKYNYTILIVEDDPDIQTYIQSEFAPNFSTLKAGNGAEALAILQSENVSLVLSDVLMPEMNGFELCRRIKSDADLSYIPVVLLTALTDDSQRIYGVSEGADDYIQKPFNIDFLKIKIIRLLEERKRLQKRFMQTMQAGGIPIIETEAKIESLDELFMRKFVDLLDVSYENTELNVEKISEELGISRVQLYRKVKEISGLSPVDYLRNYRLSKATTLLNQKRYSVSEVAYRTGFSSPAYFAKCFKSVFNMTPTEYVSQE